MEYLSDVTLLCVVVVNIVIIMASCVLNTGTVNHPKKKNIMATTILLLVNFIFDIAVLVYFMLNAMIENGKIFVLFLPLTGMLLYENIKEIRMISR